MEPLERLLNLVGLLLETATPLTFEQIRETLDAYRADKVDSAKRMFERDKDQLREFGIPLQLVDTDVWGTEQGYMIPKDEYYLPEIAFTPRSSARCWWRRRAAGRTPAPSRQRANSSTVPTGECSPDSPGGRSHPALTLGAHW